jgi:DNA-binding NtrC family response regulator
MDRLMLTPEGNGPVVLLVSDDRGTIIVLRALLERLGAIVRVARSAAEARTMLQRDVEWVVMDPVMDTAERVELIDWARSAGLAAEFIVMAQMRDIEGVLEVMGYSMAG